MHAWNTCYQLSAAVRKLIEKSPVLNGEIVTRVSVRKRNSVGSLLNVRIDTTESLVSEFDKHMVVVLIVILRIAKM